MTVEQTIAEAVRQVVREEVEPLRRAVAALRRARAENDAVSVTEAARRLGFSTKTVRRRIADGTLRCIGVGPSRRVILEQPDPDPS